MKKMPRILLITDTKKIDVLEAARNLPKNSGIILRDYALSFEKRLALGTLLKKIAREKKLLILAGNSPKLALALDLDGVHFPEYNSAAVRIWKYKKPNWIITTSAHSRIAVQNAKKFGADAVLVSPIFPTSSHRDKKPLGVIKAQKLIKQGTLYNIYSYALGGINQQTARSAEIGGFLGFAGISGLKNCATWATVGKANRKKY